MQALLFRPSVPRYLGAKVLGRSYPVRALPLHLGGVPEPEPLRGFERLKVRLAGICGSDLGVLYGTTSPVLSPLYSFPAVLGHEILAELGGVRVVVNPMLACHERGLPDCPACARGDDHLCQNTAEGNLAPGMLGYCADLPGGFSQRILAHRERIFPIPSEIPDARAVLAEPLAVALRGVKPVVQAQPKEVLIIGAGTIGLLSVRVLRLLGYAGSVHVVARRAYRAALAKAMGASYTHTSAPSAQAAVQAQRYRGLLRSTAWRGGFDVVIEASGSPSALQHAVWAVEEGGQVVLLGAPGAAFHDFSPHWSREVRLSGSFGYNWDGFAEAVKLLGEAEGIEQLVTAQYPLSAWPQAVAAAAKRRAVKVVFKP
jgi:threonine dehydrogenase-like Zn-dependent dehydrogenase